jgi:hypothetical protein
MMVLVIALVFAWGFSKRTEVEEVTDSVSLTNGKVPTVAELEAQSNLPIEVSASQDAPTPAVPLQQD